MSKNRSSGQVLRNVCRGYVSIRNEVIRRALRVAMNSVVREKYYRGALHNVKDVLKRALDGEADRDALLDGVDSVNGALYLEDTWKTELEMLINEEAKKYELYLEEKKKQGWKVG